MTQEKTNPAPVTQTQPFAWYWHDQHGCLYITGDDRKPEVPAEAKPLYEHPPQEHLVAVKPLEWNPYRAETPFGWYDINDQSDVPESELKGRPPFLLSGSRMDYSRHGTLDAARSAAQADYEARIRAALTTEGQNNG